MRLRTMIGFGIGYLLGARSDTNRYDNLQELYQSVTQSPIFKALMQQAKQTAASGMQSLTGQQPSWAGGGNGGQARQQTGQGQQPQQAEQSQGGQQGKSEQGKSEQEQEKAEQGKSEQEEEKAEQGGGGQGEKQKQESGQSSS